MNINYAAQNILNNANVWLGSQLLWFNTSCLCLDQPFSEIDLKYNDSRKNWEKKLRIWKIESPITDGCLTRHVWFLPDTIKIWQMSHAWWKIRKQMILWLFVIKKIKNCSTLSCQENITFIFALNPTFSNICPCFRNWLA